MKKLPIFVFMILLGILPAGALVNIGGGELFVDIATRLEMENNLFSNSKEVNDFLWRTTPGLSYERKKGVIGLDAALSASVLKFFEESAQNAENYNFRTSIRRPKERDYPLNYDVGFRYNIASSPNEDIGARLRSRYLSMTAGGEYDLFGKWALSLNTDFTRTDFVNTTASDTSQKSVGSAVVYRYTPKLNLMLGNIMTFYNVKGENSPDGMSNSYYLGAYGMPSPKLDGELKVGLTRRTFSNDLFSAQTNPFYSTRINWYPYEKTKVTGVFAKSFDVTAGKQSKFSTDAGLSVSQKFSDKLTLGVEVGYDLIQYDTAANAGSGRTDKVKYIGLSYSYKVIDGISIGGHSIMEGIKIEGTLRYAKRTSDSEFFSFNDPNMGIGVSHQF